MPSSTILTPDAKKKGLKEINNKIVDVLVTIKAAKEDIKPLAKDVVEKGKLITKLNKDIEKLAVILNKLAEARDALKATEVTPPKVSKNGKPLGRPRLTAEEKERRRVARETGIVEPAVVAVPPDLQPLIPNETAQEGEGAILAPHIGGGVAA
jgi:hypothetical protein